MSYKLAGMTGRFHLFRLTIHLRSPNFLSQSGLGSDQPLLTFMSHHNGLLPKAVRHHNTIYPQHDLSYEPQLILHCFVSGSRQSVAVTDDNAWRISCKDGPFVKAISTCFCTNAASTASLATLYAKSPVSFMSSSSVWPTGSRSNICCIVFTRTWVNSYWYCCK